MAVGQTNRFTRQRRRGRPPTSTLLLLLLLGAVGARQNGSSVPALQVTSSSTPSSSSVQSTPSTPSSSSSQSSASLVLPVCDLFLVPFSNHSLPSSSALLYIHDSEDDEKHQEEEEQEQAQQQQPNQQIPPGTALYMQLNCTGKVTPDTIAGIYQNGMHIFDGTLKELNRYLHYLDKADNISGLDGPMSEQEYELLSPHLPVFHPPTPSPRPPPNPLDSLPHQETTLLWNVLLLLGYGLILVVSLPGNLLVCRIIISTPKLRTTTNILILSLTVSDIATTIFNIPFMCARTMLQNWPLPDCFCLLMPTVQVSSVYVSTFTMAAIGIHRFRAVRVGPLMAAPPRSTAANGNPPASSSKASKPYSPYVMTKEMIVLWIAGIWLASILLALPHSLFNQVVDDSPGLFQDQQGLSQSARRCRAMYPPAYESTIALILSLETSLTQYLLPLTVTAVLYTKIALIIQRQGQLARHFCDELNRRAVEAKRKRISMLIIVVAAFAISWAPLNFYHLLIDLHQVSFNHYIFMVLHQLAVLSVCYNPFIYCWMNEAFRVRAKKYFRLVGKLCPCLRWCCCCGKTRRKRRGKGGKQSSRTIRSRLLCVGEAARRCSSAGTSTIGGEEAYSLSGVGGEGRGAGGGGGGGGMLAGNNTTATTTTTLTTRVSSFTKSAANQSPISSLHASASAATIVLMDQTDRTLNSSLHN